MSPTAPKQIVANPVEAVLFSVYPFFRNIVLRIRITCLVSIYILQADSSVRTGRQCGRQQLLVHICLYPVIPVHKAYIVSMCRLGAIPSCAGRALILLMNHMKTLIRLYIFITYYFRPIARPVIYKNHLQILV